MNTTVGNLITDLFDRYARAYADSHLTAIVIQQRVNDILPRSARRGASRR
jgi:hypothetical protein